MENPRFSLEKLVETLNKTYSVGNAERLEEFYDSQVAQYPLYNKWMDLVIEIVKTKGKLSVLEYGFGPGYLTEKLLNLENVIKYLGVEPHEDFIKITKRKIKKNENKMTIEKSTAEEFATNEQFDFIICQASYHHMKNKPKALDNMYNHLKDGGMLIIAEVFLPAYKYNKDYEPEDGVEYVNSVSRYTTRQLQAMPSPTIREFKDQMIAWFLDIIGFDEYKVCIDVFKDQMEKTKFQNIEIKLLEGEDKTFDWEGLGYYFITALK